MFCLSYRLRQFVSIACATFAATAASVSLADLPEPIRWDGEGGDGDWQNDTNWVGDIEPTGGDDVVLDHSNLSGPYAVTIYNFTTVRSLTIGEPGNTDEIRLIIPDTNTFAVEPGQAGSPPLRIFQADAPAETLVIEAGGVLENAGGNTDPTLITIDNGIRDGDTDNTTVVRENGRYIHGTLTSFSAAFPTSGAGATTYAPGSYVEFGGNSSTNVPLDGRTFDWLEFSAFGTKSYTSVFESNNPCTISTALTVGDNCTAILGSSVSGQAINIGGAIYNYGDIYFEGASSPTSGIRFVGGCFINGDSNNHVFTSEADPDADLVVESGAILGIGLGMEFVVRKGSLIGEGGFSLDPGSVLRIDQPGGMDTAIACEGAKTLPAEGIYEFGNALAITGVTGLTFPDTVEFLRLDRPSTDTATLVLSKPVLVTSVLALISGRIITDTTNTLTLESGAGSTSLGGSVSGTGFLRNVEAADLGTYIFHISSGPGEVDNFSPLTIEVTGGTGTGSIRAYVTGSAHPNLSNPATSLARYWTITPSGLTGLTTNVRFDYNSASVNGSENDYKIGRHLGGAAWQIFDPTTFDPGENWIALENVSGFSDWTIGEASGVPVVVSGFAAE